MMDVTQMIIDGEPCTAKRVRIHDLPDCYYKERLSEMVLDTGATVCVVGKPGYVGDWAAYIGHPSFNMWKPEHREAMTPYALQGLSHPEGTSWYGDKLDEETAKALFPEYADLKYRR